MAGFHTILLTQNKKVYDILKTGKGRIIKPAGALLFQGGGTANFKMGSQSWQYGYAMLDPSCTSSDQDVIVVKTRMRLKNQINYGMFAVDGSNEQFCPDPHTNFHIYPPAMIGLIARKAGDTDTVKIVQDYFKALAATYKEFPCDPKKSIVVAPGYRCNPQKERPQSQAAYWLGASFGFLPMNKFVANKDTMDLDNFWFTHPLSDLMEFYPDIKIASKPMKTRQEVTILENETTIVISMAKPGIAMNGLVDPCWWIKWDKASRTYQYSTDLGTQIPVIGFSRKVVI